MLTRNAEHSLPAFHFLYLQLKSAQEKHLLKPYEALSREFIITDQIVRRLVRVIRVYRSSQKDAIDISNAVINKHSTSINDTNNFLLGLHLLDLHYNLQGKQIHINLLEQFLELCDSIFQELDKELIEKSIVTAKEIYVDLLQHHLERFEYKEERVNLMFR